MEPTNRERVIKLIAEHGPRTSLQIQLVIDSEQRQSAKNLLAKLKLKGLVDCERDGRIGWWFLTPTGVDEFDRLEAQS